MKVTTAQMQNAFKMVIKSLLLLLFYCNEMFSKSPRMMGGFSAPNACIGFNEEDDRFICELCF